jgi:3-dehydro-4-phosphotetronate decarboxylase
VIQALAAHHAAVLLESHGPVKAGITLDAAVLAIEEFEDAAKLTILLHGMPFRQLGPAAIADLERCFKRLQVVRQAFPAISTSTFFGIRTPSP